jgi:hypothetical protein
VKAKEAEGATEIPVTKVARKIGSENKMQKKPSPQILPEL